MEFKIQIGYYPDVRSNLYDLLKRSKVEVRMAGGRVAIAAATGYEEKFVVWFDDDSLQMVYWYEADEIIAEITGLVCGRCKQVVQVKRLDGRCEECI